MEISKRLVINFKTVLGKKVALLMDNPREYLTESINDLFKSILRIKLYEFIFRA